VSSHTWISWGADFVKFSSTLGVGSGTTGADRGTTGATAEPHKKIVIGNIHAVFTVKLFAKFEDTGACSVRYSTFSWKFFNNNRYRYHST
jgi:hypothetical protein